MAKAVTVEIAGKTLTLSNLDKLMYPEAGFTKAQVIDYYTRIAPAMLPHLADRPISLKRFPDGVDGMSFYEKRCPAHRPGWVGTCTIPVKSGEIAFCTVDNVGTLAWLGNIACLEIHAYLYRRAAPQVPTMMVFDLDPGEPASLIDSCRIGLLVRGLLAANGLECLVKSSGSKGLHLYVPLNRPISFERTKAFAREVAMRLERDHPGHVTSVMAKSERGGKVFIDWSQNDAAKTTCCVYSLRARARPTVSAPVSWNEVERAVRADDASGLVIEADQALARVAREGDAFAELERMRQTLPETVRESAPPKAPKAATQAKTPLRVKSSATVKSSAKAGKATPTARSGRSTGRRSAPRSAKR